MPITDSPFGASRPTTTNGTFLIRTTRPIGLSPRDTRFVRVLLEAVGALADLLEARVAARPPLGPALARLSRLVARELGCAPSVVDEIGLAAHLFAVDRALKESVSLGDDDLPEDLAGALGWAAGSPEGITPVLRALASVAEGFPAPWVVAPGGEHAIDAPLGAQVIAAVSEYLALTAATLDGQPDRETVNQLLRVTTAPEIIEALGRVLDQERGKESIDVG